jgi:hypothetical protein
VAGTEGWVDAAGGAINTDVWSFGEGLGPNGENVLTSQSGSTADVALCQKWGLDAGTYVVMYDIKGAAEIGYRYQGGMSVKDVADGSPIYFGITYIPGSERQGGNLGSNVNVANPQIICCFGETQDEPAGIVGDVNGNE